jgi:large subunit ribosomal protein L15
MPLQRRVPKFGFKNNNKIVSKPVNLDVLEAIHEKTKSADINPELLRENGLIGKGDVVKVLGRGELKTKLNLTVHKISKTAQDAVEKAGGTVTLISK